MKYLLIALVFLGGCKEQKILSIFPERADVFKIQDSDEIRINTKPITWIVIHTIKENIRIECKGKISNNLCDDIGTITRVKNKVRK